MRQNINKEMLKVLSSQVYGRCAMDISKVIQNIERSTLLEMALGFCQEILRKLLIKMVDVRDLWFRQNKKRY
jgi:hypothetical protein